MPFKLYEKLVRLQVVSLGRNNITRSATQWERKKGTAKIVTMAIKFTTLGFWNLKRQGQGRKDDDEDEDVYKKGFRYFKDLSHIYLWKKGYSSFLFFLLLRFCCGTTMTIMFLTF